ncbi:MAG: TonB-dependent receptor [Bacteroidales bacterium]|nr:TonB-dependent receptor [Bacteroidales bacterium]
MGRKIIILFVCSLLQTVMLGQPDSLLRSRIDSYDLGSDELFFPEDSVNVNVVSASPSSKNPDELPVTIFTIGREEIIKNQYTSLSDVLKRLPGIRVSQPGSGELGEIFQLRGLTGNMYTKILVNGLPVKPSVVNGMPVLSQLPVRQAERIEVVYGPSAAVYGADAVSGVINIITREAERGTFASGDISLGQNDFMSFNFMVGGKAGRNKNILQYSFYGGKTGFNDMNIKSGYEKVYNPLHYLQGTSTLFTLGGVEYAPLDINKTLLNQHNIDPSDFIDNEYPVNYSGDLLLPRMEELPSESNMLGLTIKFRDFSFSFSNMYRRSHSSLGLTGYLYKYDNPQAYWGENIKRTTLSHSKEWLPGFNTTTNLSSLNYRMDNNSSQSLTFVDYSDLFYRYSAGDDFLFEEIITLVPGNSLEFVGGLSYQYSGNLPQTSYLDSPFDPKDYKSFSKKINVTDTLFAGFGVNPVTFHNLSAFGQAYYSVKKIRVMGGLRYDNNSIYKTSISPRVAALYLLNGKTSIRASLGFAYKAPPSSLAYQSLGYRTGSDLDSMIYLAAPNPGLLPEEYMSVEMGLIRKVSSKYRFDLSIYYNRINNLIYDQNIPVDEINTLPAAVALTDTSTIRVKANAENSVARLYGLQATLKWTNIVESIKMDAELSLTFAKSSESFPDIFSIAGDFLSDFTLTPQHFGQMQISMEPVDGLYINIAGIWESNWLRVLIPLEEIYEDIFKNADGFYSLDVLARYSFNNSLSMYLKVNNLFDEKYGGLGMNKYYGLPYNPQLGRNIRFGLTYAWN